MDTSKKDEIEKLQSVLWQAGVNAGQMVNVTNALIEAGYDSSTPEASGGSVETILKKYIQTAQRNVGNGCNHHEYILGDDIQKIAFEINGEIEKHKEHLRAAAYTIWKGCESIFSFEEWKENWLIQNDLAGAKWAGQATPVKSDWEETFWYEMNKQRPYAEHIPEICDTFQYLRDNVINPLLASTHTPVKSEGGIDAAVERGMKLVKELKHKTQLALDEGSPYHETAEARTMAFEHGWDACKEYFGITQSTPTPIKESIEGKEDCEANHLNIDALLNEFNRRGFNTENWDGDEGAEKAIVDGVCHHIQDMQLNFLSEINKLKAQSCPNSINITSLQQRFADHLGVKELDTSDAYAVEWTITNWNDVE